MIEIEVGKHNVTHVAWTKAKLLDLMDCRVFSLELNAIEMNEKRANPRATFLNITLSETCINEHKPLVCLDKQAMANEMGC
ncbi:hypothetical protein NUACC21_31910 [Scytonema sp. NUACC21]